MLIFDISSKFASFKKFYTNSSSMSYLFPPRTVLEGIIGAIIGYDFNSYYEKLNFKNALISAVPKTKIRTYMSNLNYIKMTERNVFFKKSDNGFIKNDEYSYTQIPFEFLLPEQFSEDITYRIYFFSKDNILMSGLRERVKNNNPKYPVSLGNANMLASLKFIADGKIYKNETGEPIRINSPSPMEYIKNISMDNYIHMQKDIIPVSFDKNRYPKTMAYIFERDGKDYNIYTDKPAIKIEYDNIFENILFPEVASNEFLFP